MPQAEQTIDIQAPPAAVFRLIADQPERMPEWWTTFELQQRVTPPPTAIGTVLRYVYNLMGIRVKGEQQVLQIDPPAHLVIKTTSGIDGMFDFHCAEQDGGTRLTVLGRLFAARIGAGSGGQPPHAGAEISARPRTRVGEIEGAGRS